MIPLVPKITPPPPISQVPASSSQASPENAQEIPGQYIVVYKDQWGGKVSAEAGRQALQFVDARISELGIDKQALKHRYQYALRGFAAKLSPTQLEALRKDPRVDYIEQDRTFKLFTSSTPAVSAASFSGQTKPWGIARLRGPLNGTGKKAWVIDSGIDLDHPDLNVDVANSASFVAQESADDLNGHGTHVAGIIAAKNNSIDVVGMAAGASVVAVKVCKQDGTCLGSDIIAGVNYVANLASANNVVNMSLGGPPSTSIDNAIINAANAGLRFTISAGNNKDDANNYSPARVEHSNVWTVSAFKQGDIFATSFSNYGNPPIEYSEPGVDILSLYKNGGTATLSGTSMAAPHLAGLLLATGGVIYTDGTVSSDPDNNPDPIAVGVISAPVLSGSVYSNSPKLSWNAVAGADHYELYRRFEFGNWTLAGTTTSTTYTDNVINSPDLQLIASPPFNYQNVYSYYVRAVPASGPSSTASNNIYYLYGPCTGSVLRISESMPHI